MSCNNRNEVCTQTQCKTSLFFLIQTCHFCLKRPHLFTIYIWYHFQWKCNCQQKKTIDLNIVNKNKVGLALLRDSLSWFYVIKSTEIVTCLRERLMLDSCKTRSVLYSDVVDEYLNRFSNRARSINMWHFWEVQLYFGIQVLHVDVILIATFGNSPG